MSTLAFQVAPEQEMMIMLIEIITYFGCLKGARLCKKVFMCIAPFIGPLVCKSSQPHFVPVVHGPQAALCRCSVAVPRLGPRLQISPF